MLLVSRTCNLDESCELAGFIKKCNRGLPFQPFRSPFDLFFFKRSFILEIVILRGKLFWSRFSELWLILESWITMEWILCQLKASSFSFKLPRVWAVKIVATDLTVVLIVHAGLANFRPSPTGCCKTDCVSVHLGLDVATREYERCLGPLAANRLETAKKKYKHKI
jgi:hypothetical protein